MRKMMLAFSFLAIFSCKKKKDEDKGTTTPSRDQLVGTYKQTGHTINGGNVFTAGGLYEACDMDDTYTLNANNTYNITDAGTTCSPSNTGTGTWSISGSTFVMDSDTMQVVNYQNGTLTLNQTISFGGMNMTNVFTYQRQ